MAANSHLRIIVVCCLSLILSNFIFAMAEVKAKPAAIRGDEIESTSKVKRRPWSFTLSDSILTCNMVLGLAEGDTCYNLMQKFGMSSDYFYSINPNIDCDNLFEGQWICVSGQQQ
ncbi:hypothetical protein ACH5RR_014995 [Cinchona calisaya]|uniref:LysM domain-containing protein n=1 Tax=Cinchona calisaya TaxID=153742 RepID=A0ABD2ZTK1_9GENT